MKKVFSNDELAHPWAHQSQYEGRNSSDSFYFRGDTIYSYGDHFPIAKHITIDKKPYVMFTTRSYSVTTSSHISITSRACNHLTKIYCKNPEANDKHAHKRNYKAMVEQIEPLKAKYVRARTNKDWFMVKLNDLVLNANRYTKLFKLGHRQIELDIDENKIKKALKIEAAKRKKAKALRVKQELADNKEKIANWLNGENVYNMPRLDSALLRVEGENVCTSWGSTFPVSDCETVWKVVQRCKTQQKEFKPNGERYHVGQFNINHISSAGHVRAACHIVKYEAIERVAIELGFITESIAA